MLILWIEQPLNHFDSNDSRTWQMQYFERLDLWKPGKPVYLFLGGEAFLKKEEQICDACDMQVPNNQQVLFFINMGSFEYAAQYGSPGEIKKICDSNFNLNYLRNFTDTTLFNNWNKENCCSYYDFDKLIEIIKTCDWYTAWLWQTCTEFGYYQTTTSSENHPFTENVPVEFHYNMCNNMFGDEYGETTVEKGVKETNSMYGA
jgi:hypothetical protein